MNAVFSLIGLVLLMYAVFSLHNVLAKWAAVLSALAWIGAIGFQMDGPGAWKWVAVVQGLNVLICINKAQQRYDAEETRREYERVMRS